MKISRFAGMLALFLLSFLIMSCSPSQNMPNVPALPEIPLIPQKIESPPPAPAILNKRHPTITAGTQKPDATRIDYQTEVKPILDGRCVVCHACYDAPCQLKFTAPEGLERGASKRKLYDGERLFPAEPTRLFVDAFTVADWRKKEFFPVLDEQAGSSEAALNASLLYQFIKLKKDHPQSSDPVLPESFKLESYRDLECPTLEEMPAFRKRHPLWGMPYGLPGLSDSEHRTLSRWLQQGAIFSPDALLPTRLKKTIDQWEAFLNQNDLKSQLISRYVFEHLAFAHIYFSDVDTQTFFTLLRSSTPPGMPIKPIVTLRPYDEPEPKVSRVYYRLQKVKETIVDKSHLAYALNDQKKQRWQDLFWTPAYVVHQLPNYSTQTAANPFVTFAAIPARARYQFMLDDAYFFISSFIKGPVCWGPIALNVINDRFFVSFTDPSHDPVSHDDNFIKNASHMLSLPAEMEDHFNLTAAWTLYAQQQKKYLTEKQSLLAQHQQRHTLAMIWPGNGQDGDGTMTIFRHYDNASVLKGFIGKTPKTAWVIDYPIFERIYYLLVAGFNEYGNVGHQLSTRLYMDFLRMESEGNFIDFLPADQQLAEHQLWYSGISPRLEQFLFNKTGLKIPSSSAQQSSRKAKKRLLFDIAQHTQTTGLAYNIAPYWTSKKNLPSSALEKILSPLTRLQGKKIQLIPDVAYLRVKFKNSEEDAVYTLINNKAHRSVNFIFGEDLRRLPKNDSLTLVRTLTGSYPNYIYTVPFEELADFVEEIEELDDEDDVEELNLRWGLRRTRPDFWAEVDWLQKKNLIINGVHTGLFDLNRYLNQ